MNYVWNYVLTSWLLVKFLVLSLVHAQLEYTSVVDVNRGPSSIYCPGGAFITILNISVKNEEYCESEPCIIDDGDHEVLRRLCDNSTNCLINESILSSACLLEHRRFNLSYFCEAPISLHCNFENDLLCSLDQERDDDFDWTRNSGRTPSTGTGPDSDHTTALKFIHEEPKERRKIKVSNGYGFYFFIEANSKRKKQKAKLISKLIVYEKTTTVLSDSTSGDSSAALETTTVSSFTTSKEGSSTVSVESVTLSRVMKNSSDSATGLVVGLVIGGLLLACAVIFIVVLFRRHTLKSRPREKLRNNLGGNDYIGSQDIVLPQTSNHSSRMQNDGMYDQLESRNTSVHGYESTQINNVQQKYTSVGADNGFVNKEGVQTPTYSVRRDKTFADNHMPNDDEYAIVDPTAETSFNETIDNSTGTADSYMVLDPTETGFNRQIFSTSPVGYEFAKPVQDTENKICGEDQYDISDEGVYDHSGSNRHKESEDNIYNHAVDTIYDSGSHKRNNEGREDTYDHFLGQTTEDDYDISTTT